LGEGQKKTESESEKERGEERGKKSRTGWREDSTTTVTEGIGWVALLQQEKGVGGAGKSDFSTASPLSNWSASLRITLTLAIEKKIKGCWCFPRSSMVR